MADTVTTAALENTCEIPRPPVPENFNKGARPTWHQLRRRRAILAMLQNLSGEVLDYGCGYGDLTYAISATHTVRGVDVDADRVAFARHEYQPLQFDVCPPDGAPFPDNSFDIVTSVVVLNFIDDAKQYLTTIHRMLRPGGHLIIACKNVPAVRNWFRGLLGRGPAPSKIWTRTRAEVLSLLADAGFGISRESYFYDVPFDGWKNPSDVFFGGVEQALSLLQVRSAAGYFVVLCRKIG